MASSGAPAATAVRLGVGYGFLGDAEDDYIEHPEWRRDHFDDNDNPWSGYPRGFPAQAAIQNVDDLQSGVLAGALPFVLRYAIVSRTGDLAPRLLPLLHATGCSLKVAGALRGGTAC